MVSASDFSLTITLMVFLVYVCGDMWYVLRRLHYGRVHNGDDEEDILMINAYSNPAAIAGWLVTLILMSAWLEYNVAMEVEQFYGENPTAHAVKPLKPE
jgi:hypothetical protein